MENNKEKYEQALERAKVINPGTADYEVAVKIFPELTENENEKMCEALIQYIKEPSVLLDWRRKEFITWLEKQSRNTSDKIVEKARTEKQRVLLTETDGSANIDWDCRSLDDVKALLNCGLEYIRTIKANKQILSANRFGGYSVTLPSRYDKSIKQGEQKPAESRYETKPNGSIIYEDFNKGDGYYKVNLAYLSKSQVELIENLVASWQNLINNTAEWSEEDNLNLNQAIYVCHQYQYVGVETWLKSLRQKIKGK